MGYSRVLPRDLFNEAKLLKCLGQLFLAYHDGKFVHEVAFEHTDAESGFVIARDDDNNELYCQNLQFFVKTKSTTDPQREVSLQSPYNSKSPYPLVAHCNVYESPVPVFKDDGTFDDDFVAAIAEIATTTPEPMNLFRISRPEALRAFGIQSAIVAAKTNMQARLMHPSGDGKMYEWCIKNQTWMRVGRYNTAARTWEVLRDTPGVPVGEREHVWLHPSDVRVEHIGVASFDIVTPCVLIYDEAFDHAEHARQQASQTEGLV